MLRTLAAHSAAAAAASSSSRTAAQRHTSAATTIGRSQHALAAAALCFNTHFASLHTLGASAATASSAASSLPAHPHHLPPRRSIHAGSDLTRRAARRGDAVAAANTPSSSAAAAAARRSAPPPPGFEHMASAAAPSAAARRLPSVGMAPPGFSSSLASDRSSSSSKSSSVGRVPSSSSSSAAAAAPGAPDLFTPFRVSAQHGADHSALFDTPEARQAAEKIMAKKGGAAAAGAAAGKEEEEKRELTAEEMLAAEEALIDARESELDSARIRHFDVSGGWQHGGGLAPGRVLDVNPDDAPLTPEQRARVLVELAVDLPLTMREFGEMFTDCGFRDDGSPLEQYNHSSPDEPHVPANEWVPVENLAQVMQLQDSFPAPTEKQLDAIEKEERRSELAFDIGETKRRRYCALVSHTAWSWTRTRLLLDYPANWSFEDGGLRYRFLGEQLQRTYLSALQCLAYFAVHAPSLAALGGEASDAMARQSWAAFAAVSARMSHTQDESAIVYEHLEQWAQDDLKDPLAMATGHHHESATDVKREAAMVRAFCGHWSEAVALERAQLVQSAERVAQAFQAMQDQGAQLPEFGLQSYMADAMQGLSRISFALMQQPLAPELDEDGNIAPAGEEAAATAAADVLGAVHTAQYAVGLAWRWASMLSERSHGLLAREVAEARARDDGDMETADRLAVTLARTAATTVAKIVLQHTAPTQDLELDPHDLLQTARMQQARAQAVVQGIETFLHFTDQVPVTPPPAAAAAAAADAPATDAPAEPQYQWSLLALSTRTDAAAAHQQLGLALEAWLLEAEAAAKDGRPATLSPTELLQLHQCVESAFRTAAELAAIEPNAAAAARVQADLDKVSDAMVLQVIKDVKEGKELEEL